MESPVVSVTGGVKKALNIQTLVLVLVVTLIIIFVVSKLTRKTLSIVDANGNVTGTGEIVNKFTWGQKA